MRFEMTESNHSRKQQRMIATLSAVMGATILVCASSLGNWETFWVATNGALTLGILCAGAYVLGSIILGTGLLNQWVRNQRLIATLITIVVVTQLLFAGLLLLDLSFSRLLLAIEVALLSLLLFIQQFIGRPLKLLLIYSVLLLFAVLPSAGAILKGKNPWDETGPPIDKVNYVFGSYHDLKVTEHRLFENYTGGQGGGIELVSDTQLLLVSGDAGIYLLSIEDGQQITQQEIVVSDPLNKSQWTQMQPDQDGRWYRVTDALLGEQIDGTRPVLVTYTYWDDTADCYNLRLAESRINLSALTAAPWVVRFQTRPCLHLDELNNTSGGKLARLPEGDLLLTTGTFKIDSPEHASDPHFDYGKVLLLDTDSWTASVYSHGHRNPQGLLVDAGLIWETEHGPQGGDELNILRQGGNYGWPRESYGTDYGQKTTTFNNRVGDHSTTTLPVYAWLPSIGVSNLIRINQTLFGGWKGDLLVASLYGFGNGASLYRLRIAEARVIVAERLHTRLPIRDLLELPDGKWVLWNGIDAVQIVEPANQLVSTCQGCHAFLLEKHGIGPDLMGVVGRKVAFHRNYNYSQAMKNFGGVWTKKRLDRFLRNPKETVPGTTMEFEGLADENQRREIIEYLQKLRYPGKE